ERDANQQHAVVQQRQRHAEQGGFLAAVHGRGRGEHAGRLAGQGPGCPFRTEPVDEVLERGGHVAEARRAAEHQARAFRQVATLDVGSAVFGHWRLRGGGDRRHRGHGTDPRPGTVRFLDAAGHQAGQPGGGAVAAVVQHQDLDHPPSVSDSPGFRFGFGYACAMALPRARIEEWLPRWMDPVKRERARAFGWFLWQRFLDDRCFESAGALAYATVFALVPLTAALFGVVSAVPAFEDWLDTLTRFVFANFVPEAARAVEQYLLEFAGSVRGMTSVGGLVLLGTALLTMKAVEDTFNRIWRVHAPRPGLARFLVYWTVLTLGPILVLGGLALSSYFISLPLIHSTYEEIGLGGRLLRLAPTAVELVGFTLAYYVLPHRTVKFRHAFFGGVLATVLFELAKYGFALYLTRA